MVSKVDLIAEWATPRPSTGRGPGFAAVWSRQVWGRQMTVSSETITPQAAVFPGTRWMQLGLGLICMVAISSPQYVWALFTKPMGAALGVSPAALQVTFSLLIVLQTFLSPLQGRLVDRFGPRRLIAIGGLLSGLSWVFASQANSLVALYLSYGLIGGVGTGIV